MYLQDTKAGHVSIAQAQQIALDICWLEWDVASDRGKKHVRLTHIASPSSFFCFFPPARWI